MERQTSVVLDSTVISNFASTDASDIIYKLFDRVRIPIGVQEEIVNGVEEGYEFLDSVIENQSSKFTASTGRSQLRRGSKDRWVRIQEELDQGEAEAVAIAILFGDLLVTDDRDAREIADEYDISYTGSLGLLARAVDQGLLTPETANEHLTTWQEEYGFYSPVDNITEVIEE